jgi:hypothetical protein
MNPKRTVPGSTLEWAVILGTMSGFAWLQIHLPLALKTPPASAVLLVLVILELAALTALNRNF